MVFKRRFTKRFTKRSTAKRGRFTGTVSKRRFGVFGNGHPIMRTAHTRLTFSQSLNTKQPMPNRYFTWVTIENSGNFATGAGSNVGNFAFALNDCDIPFTKSGATAATLPNPVVALANQSPTSFRNLMFNSITVTGFYNTYRVWATRVRIHFTPGNAADTVHCFAVPVLTASATYATTTAAQSGPNTSTWTSSFGGSGQSQSKEFMHSIPDLLGIPRNLYSSYSNSNTTTGGTPTDKVFLQCGYIDDANNPLTAVLGVRVEVSYHCEFFAREDTHLTTT